MHIYVSINMKISFQRNSNFSGKLTHSWVNEIMILLYLGKLDNEITILRNVRFTLKSISNFSRSWIRKKSFHISYSWEGQKEMNKKNKHLKWIWVSLLECHNNQSFMICNTIQCNNFFCNAEYNVSSINAFVTWLCFQKESIKQDLFLDILIWYYSENH